MKGSSRGIPVGSPSGIPSIPAVSRAGVANRGVYEADEAPSVNRGLFMLMYGVWMLGPCLDSQRGYWISAELTGFIA